MPLNPFFLQGSQSEQRLVQDLINEQLGIYGVEVLYLPRRIVKKDSLFTELESSRFSDNFAIEAYVNTYEGYGGAGMGLLGRTVIMEETGYTLFSAPFFSTCVLAADIIEAFASEDDKADLLNKIASGDKNWVDVVRGVYDVFNPTVVKMLGSTNLERDKHRRVLGTDEETGAEISVYIGKFGPVAKRSGGTVDDRFAPIKEADIKNITLREALQLFKYPKRICSISGKGVTLNSGKYGLYLKYNGKNYSTNGKSEADLTEDECRAIIEGTCKNTGDSKGYYRKISSNGWQR